MKLSEVLDPGIMADRIAVTKKDKSESTKALMRFLRKKADSRNRENRKENKYVERGGTDSFAGYMNDTFAQSNWG